MGLKQKTGNIQYVRISDGKFYLSTDKEKSESFDELEGQLVDISIRNEEFQGKKFRKTSLTLVDGEDTYIVSFPFDSAYTSTVTSFLKMVDTTKPLSLVPSMKKDGDNERRALLIKQDGSFAKSYFTQANPHGQPKFKAVKINGETKWDKTDFLEFTENVLLNEIKPSLQKTGTYTESRTEMHKVPTPSAAMSDTGDSYDDMADDLPF